MVTRRLVALAVVLALVGGGLAWWFTRGNGAPGGDAKPRPATAYPAATRPAATTVPTTARDRSGTERPDARTAAPASPTRTTPSSAFSNHGSARAKATTATAPQRAAPVRSSQANEAADSARKVQLGSDCVADEYQDALTDHSGHPTARARATSAAGPRPTTMRSSSHIDAANNADHTSTVPAHAGHDIPTLRTSSPVCSRWAGMRWPL